MRNLSRTAAGKQLVTSADKRKKGRMESPATKPVVATASSSRADTTPVSHTAPTYKARFFDVAGRKAEQAVKGAPAPAVNPSPNPEV